MNQLKQFFISESEAFISAAMRKSTSHIVPTGFSIEEYESLRVSLRTFIEKTTGQKLAEKIVMTGHQPDFIHPGILAKDFLTAKIAADTGASGIHLIVDTDQVGMEFHLPVIEGEKIFIQNFQFHKREHNIYKYVKTSPEDIEKLESICFRMKAWKGIFPDHVYHSIITKLNELTKSVHTKEYFYQVTEEFRNQFTQQENLNLIDIHLSDLIQSECFLVFVEKIRQRLPEFRHSFNKNLHNYRLHHKIKNSAQPVPDLKENEMPFWIVDKEGNRSHMHADSANTNVIPRANTLTMFLRLFLADLFIHGTGGGRYEDVSNNTLTEFFGTTGAPYLVATATMNISPVGGYNPDFPDKRTLAQKERNLIYAPDRFLSTDHPLVLQKKQWIQKLNSAERGKKLPIHKQIMALNDEMRKSLSSVEEEVKRQMKELPTQQHKKEVFTARNLPFIFYDSLELKNYLQELNF